MVVPLPKQFAETLKDRVVEAASLSTCYVMLLLTVHTVHTSQHRGQIILSQLVVEWWHIVQVIFDSSTAIIAAAVADVFMINLRGR